MKAKDVIECYNKYIEKSRRLHSIDATGHLVLHYSIKPNETFKSYKEYRYTLWLIVGSNKHIILEDVNVVRATTDIIAEVEEQLEIAFITKVIEIMNAALNNIIMGIYREEDYEIT